ILTTPIKDLEKLPSSVRELLLGDLSKEFRAWSKELEKNCQGYRKDIEKSPEQAQDFLKKIQSVSTEMSNLPKFVQVPFSQVVTRLRAEIKQVDMDYQYRIQETQLKEISKSFKQISKGAEIIELTRLSEVSNIPIGLIRALVPRLLAVNPSYGYLDSRIVLFSEKILQKAGQFINTLRDDLQMALSNSKMTESFKIVKQSLEYCEFLIHGYSFLSQPTVAKRFVDERQFFRDNLVDLEQKLSRIS
ncbi:MAG TPA: hypothetical protein VJ044_08415, partial [Candidatus Hodarchaeales archaeon]|nr:hypothetical protein [Candidatus Hodarchaeales archaeon]